MAMTPENAIESMENLLGEITRRAGYLRAESEGVAEQWEGLRRIRGQRADHAAALLGRLRPHLRDLATFAKSVETQIDAMVADPFGRKIA